MKESIQGFDNVRNKGWTRKGKDKMILEMMNYFLPYFNRRRREEMNQ
jgi:hypothetical protein